MNFQFGGHEVLSSASFNTSRPHSNCFHAANQYVFGKKNLSASPQKDCALLSVDFLSRSDEMIVLRSNSEGMRF